MVNVIVSGATGGLGSEISEFTSGDNTKKLIILGGRNKSKLQELKTKLDAKTILEGDLFKPGTKANKFALNNVPNMTGTFYHNAAINVDPIPEGVNKDSINPENGKKWTKSDNREEIRKKITEKEMVFIDDFINKLLNRDSRKPLKVVLAGSVMAKFIENPIVNKSSTYGVTKKEIYNKFIKNREKLKKVGVTFNIPGLGLFESNMLRINTLDKTGALLSLVGPSYPLNGEYMPVSMPMKAKEVAKKIIGIGEKNLTNIASFLPLYDTTDFDVKKEEKDFLDHKSKYLNHLKKKKISLDNEGYISINESLKNYLYSLRKEAIEEYSNKYLSKLDETEEGFLKKTRFFSRNIETNLNKGNNIIKSLNGKIGKDEFAQLCYRLEKNHP